MSARRSAGAPPPSVEHVLEGVSTVSESLGRALVCLNSEFQVVHASVGLNRLVGPGAADAMIGKSVAEIFGEDLFGSDGSLRRALAAGERREGWGATLRVDRRRPRLVSVTTAPIQHFNPEVCDPRVAFVVVLRPGEDDSETGGAAPTMFSGLVARSASMMRIFQLIEQLAETDATVLIAGESGTGKELVARAIHVQSRRRAGPFVAVNCGAIPENLLETELYGHTRGAYTGATRDRVGRFELAAKGTIFLDEVGHMPRSQQVKLLRVLQEKTFERVGESVSRTSDARVIAATNRNLRRAVDDGEFRQDLYYRLRVVPIRVPALRDRREDIEPIARHLLRRVGSRYGRSVQLAPDALRALLGYRWPGNVRELENAIEFAMAVTRGQTIHAQDLPVEITTAEPAERVVEPTISEHVGGDATRAERGASSPEADRLRAVLAAHQWRRARAAQALGISRATLWRKMKEHGLAD